MSEKIMGSRPVLTKSSQFSLLWFTIWPVGKSWISTSIFFETLYSRYLSTSALYVLKISIFFFFFFYSTPQGVTELLITCQPERGYFSGLGTTKRSNKPMVDLEAFGTSAILWFFWYVHISQYIVWFYSQTMIVPNFKNINDFTITIMWALSHFKSTQKKMLWFKKSER